MNRIHGNLTNRGPTSARKRIENPVVGSSSLPFTFFAIPRKSGRRGRGSREYPPPRQAPTGGNTDGPFFIWPFEYSGFARRSLNPFNRVLRPQPCLPRSRNHPRVDPPLFTPSSTSPITPHPASLVESAFSRYTARDVMRPSSIAVVSTPDNRLPPRVYRLCISLIQSRMKTRTTRETGEPVVHTEVKTSWFGATDAGLESLATGIWEF
ncbi:hypothetical protein KM043_016951 [Ampulex compressa]|nr:hypothetical protein KM043_016951 [Ampulex compressa]